jgi:CRISP-associated protein Cas1
MIKQTLYFGSPYYLSKKLEQLVIKIPNAQGLDEIGKDNTCCIEDLGLVMLDHPQITVSQGLLASLLANNVAIVTCDDRHHPAGLLLPLEGHHTQAKHVKAQLEASEPLKKQLWQQVVVSKILNQAEVLRQVGKAHAPMLIFAKNVKSGDPDNYEARAAAYYWATLFDKSLGFRRNRDGDPPNNLLNYGYAIVRALVARAVVGAGLLPVLGVHHHNQYNSFALADDLMEPFRPMIDLIVYQIVTSSKDYDTLTKDLKTKLLGIAEVDVKIKNERSPLLNATHFVATSLVKSYEGTQRKLTLPSFNTKPDKAQDLHL